MIKGQEDQNHVSEGFRRIFEVVKDEEELLVQLADASVEADRQFVFVYRVFLRNLNFFQIFVFGHFWVFLMVLGAVVGSRVCFRVD